MDIYWPQKALRLLLSIHLFYNYNKQFTFLSAKFHPNFCDYHLTMTSPIFGWTVVMFVASYLNSNSTFEDTSIAPLEYGGVLPPQLLYECILCRKEPLACIHIYFCALCILRSKSYTTSVWQVILTPAVLLSLKALGHCSAGPTGLALPQRTDSMAGADLWIFICYICCSCQPNGFFASMAFPSPRGAAALNHTRSKWLQRFFWLVEIELGGWGSG